MTAAEASSSQPGTPITTEVVKALQHELGQDWVVGTGTYPQGRRITAMPWPPTWAPPGKIVIGENADQVRAEIKRRKEAACGGS